jgi:hypothetical protein
MFLLEILIFKGLIARRLYKSFGVKGLTGEAPGIHEFGTIKLYNPGAVKHPVLSI